MRTIKRSECSILPLVLKGKWYEMIDRGVKPYEYRFATPYWTKRFSNWINRHLDRNVESVVEFRLGYQTNAPRMAWTVNGVYVKAFAMNPEWGEPEQKHFAIKLGERIELEETK